MGAVARPCESVRNRTSGHPHTDAQHHLSMEVGEQCPSPLPDAGCSKWWPDPRLAWPAGGRRRRRRRTSGSSPQLTRTPSSAEAPGSVVTIRSVQPRASLSSRHHPEPSSILSTSREPLRTSGRCRTPRGMYGYLTDRGTLFVNGNLPTGRFPGRLAGALAGGVVLEVDWSGKVLWELRQPDHHHDGRLLPNANVLLLCSIELPDGIVRQVTGGLPGTEINGTMFGAYLIEMTTAGQPVWEWRTWEHLDPATYTYTQPSTDRSEWTHANAVHELPDGNVLMSLRHLSTVLRINRQTNEIDWKLGAPPLSGSHGVNPLANGNYLLFDNGPYRADLGTIMPVNYAPFSRELEINPDTNAIDWSYQDPARAGLWSPLISNAQRLPTGATRSGEPTLKPPSSHPFAGDSYTWTGTISFG